LTDATRYVATFFPVWDWDYTDKLIKRFGLSEWQTLSRMSAGQRRLAELFLVLAQKPDLLILDDPVRGLDVTIRREFLWAALETQSQDGKAVLFTSHIVQDVERIADTIGILDQGRLRALGEVDELKAQTKRLILPLTDDDGPEPLPGEVSRRRLREELAVVTERFSECEESGLRARFPTLQVEDLNLEDIYCELLPGKMSRED
jgi:ABC-2 type transport system ATP-binding protein